MCLTIPAKIVKIKKENAIAVDYKNNQKEIIIAHLNKVEIDDWVLINANIAINKISKKEADELISLLKK